MYKSDDIKVSIDRLTIVAEDNLVLPIGQLPDLPCLKFYKERNDVYQIEIEYSDEYGDVITENIAYINYYSYGRNSYGIRVDFNPNRRNSISENHEGWNTLDKILTGMIGKKRLSRIDIAFDVFDSRMANYFYYKSGITKTIFGRNGSTETIYYGSPLSDKQIRQYNKQKEQLKKGLRSNEWWRLEIQLRTKYIDLAKEQIEDMLIWFKESDWEYLEDINDILFMKGLDVTPNGYSRLSKHMKTKVNKIRLESPNNSLTLELMNCYEQQKSNLHEELRRYISTHEITF